MCRTFFNQKKYYVDIQMYKWFLKFYFKFESLSWKLFSLTTTSLFLENNWLMVLRMFNSVDIIYFDFGEQRSKWDWSFVSKTELKQNFKTGMFICNQQ